MSVRSPGAHLFDHAIGGQSGCGAFEAGARFERAARLGVDGARCRLCAAVARLLLLLLLLAGHTVHTSLPYAQLCDILLALLDRLIRMKIKCINQ